MGLLTDHDARRLRRPSTLLSPTTPGAGASGASSSKRDVDASVPASAKRPRVEAGSGPSAASAAAFGRPSAPAYEDEVSIEGPKQWLHLQAPWIQDIKDSKKRRPGEPGYDPTTLWYPKSLNDSGDKIKFKPMFSPAQMQWWAIKAAHFDTVLVFKVGKFYEMFHMDAEIGVRELGLRYMGNKDNAHAGFPEAAFAKYAQQLVDRNYRVARVEQTETPATAQGKTVAREACQFLSAGTNIAQDQGEAGSAAARDHSEKYMLSLTERRSDGASAVEFGVCVLDSSTSCFEVGSFVDDEYQTRLATLLSQLQPVEVVFVQGGLSTTTSTTIRKEIPGALLSASGSKEKWGAGHTVKELAEGDGNCGPYFKPDAEAMETDDDDLAAWPKPLRQLVEKHRGDDETAKEASGLALEALGGCVAYLRQQLVDFEMVGLKNFHAFVPYDDTGATAERAPRRMVLDTNSIANLEILVNEFGEKEYSLLDYLDHCSTSTGKRLFKKWLLSPLYRPADINARLDAVEELMGLSEDATKLGKSAQKLPDFERLLARIHGTGNQPSDHPMARAIIYEDVSKRRINALQTALNGFRELYKIISRFVSAAERAGGLKTKTLRKLCIIKPGGSRTGLPELETVLEEFDDQFDLSGDIPKPNPGKDAEYDESMEEIKRVRQKLQGALRDARDDLGCDNIEFINQDGATRNRYCLDMPLDVGESAGGRYIFDSKVKGKKRWRGRTRNIENLVAELEAAEDVRDEECKNMLKRVSAKFAMSYPLFKRAWECLAELDAMISLSVASQSTSQLPVCRPEIVDTGTDGDTVFELVKAWHPIMASHNEAFIANDTKLGGDHANCLVLTGPNMGGKSTLLRQTAVVSIMAQLGCYVPAEKCRLSPTDRIFTRMGARDSIMTGESTFMVEMNEAAIVLRNASKHSLVLMDELGRGTSTFDGVAIAYGVVKELSTVIKCRSLFSTHYHTLMPDFIADPSIYLAHMGCLAEEDRGSEETRTDLDITFLYTLTDGACPQRSMPTICCTHATRVLL